MSDLYPFKFEPILKERIWGGEKLKTILNKKSKLAHLGESWEVSDVEGEVSVVSNGKFKGYSLKELTKTFRHELLGVKNHNKFQDKFPLLIK